MSFSLDISLFLSVCEFCSLTRVRSDRAAASDGLYIRSVGKYSGSSSVRRGATRGELTTRTQRAQSPSRRSRPEDRLALLQEAVSIDPVGGMTKRPGASGIPSGIFPASAGI